MHKPTRFDESAFLNPEKESDSFAPVWRNSFGLRDNKLERH
jgi:hypothetical protein